MSRITDRFPVLVLTAALMAGLLCAGASFAEDKPLRAGTVLSTTASGLFNYNLAKDGSGKEFWFITDLCPIPKGAKVEILSGNHYDKLQERLMGKTIEDVYAVDSMTIDGKEQEGLTAHGLPKECVEVK